MDAPIITDPADPADRLDGSVANDASTGEGEGDGGSAAGDGSAYPGPFGDPKETEVCVGSACSSSVDRCPDDEVKDWPGICGGGGGDVCTGADATQTGTNQAPHVPNGLTLPAGAATGGAGSGDCARAATATRSSSGAAPEGLKIKAQGRGSRVSDVVLGSARDIRVPIALPSGRPFGPSKLKNRRAVPFFTGIRPTMR